MDGFRACVSISTIDLTAGLFGKSRYDSVEIEMTGVIGICIDAGYGDHKSGKVRKLKASVSIVARFGEKSLECGVPHDLTGVCIGAMDVRVWDENDSRRPSDIHATLRVALPWDFLPHFLTLREHDLEVVPSFYREPDMEDKMTKITGYGFITSYLTHIKFSPVMPNVE